MERIFKKKPGKHSQKSPTEKLEATKKRQSSQGVQKPSELSAERTIKIPSSSSFPVIESLVLMGNS